MISASSSKGFYGYVHKEKAVKTAFYQWREYVRIELTQDAPNASHWL